MQIGTLAGDTYLGKFHNTSFHTRPVESWMHCVILWFYSRVTEIGVVPFHNFVSQDRWNDNSFLVGQQAISHDIHDLVIRVTRGLYEAMRQCLRVSIFILTLFDVVTVEYAIS